MGETDTLKKWINESNYIVFFGGAVFRPRAISRISEARTGCTIRSMNYPPETILSHSFYMRKPEEFYRFYRNKMLIPECKAEPGTSGTGEAGAGRKAESGHYPEYRRLHQAAGSKEVLSCTDRCSATIVRAAAGFTDWMIF